MRSIWRCGCATRCARARAEACGTGPTIPAGEPIMSFEGHDEDTLAATLREAGRDAEQLSILRICWLIAAWLSVVGVAASLGYVAVGGFIRHLATTPQAGDTPPAFVGWIMSGIG